jgi:lipopolysaccharide export system protein LptC
MTTNPYRRTSYGSMKLALILSSFFIVLGLIFWPTLEKIFINYGGGVEEKKFYEKVKKSNIQSKEMINPRYVSEDQKQRPYVVAAKKGINQKDNLIKLDAVTASMEVSDTSGDRLSITSQKGDVTPGKEGVADLMGQVIVSHNQDYTLFTDKAHVDFEKGEIDTDQLVEGQGIYGDLQAQGLKFNTQEQILELKGKTKIRIESKGGEGHAH